MVEGDGTRLIAVYESEQQARAAAEAARRAGASDDIRIGAPEDRIVAVEAEMREDLDQSVVPGAGPFTKDMTKGVTLGTVVGGAVGLVCALPFAAINFGDWPLWARLVTVAIVGVAVGATVGFLIGGYFGAERPGEPLVTERGVILSVPSRPGVEEALVRTDALRVYLVSADGQPVRTIKSVDPEPIAHKIARRAAEESRRD